MVYITASCQTIVTHTFFTVRKVHQPPSIYLVLFTLMQLDQPYANVFYISVDLHFVTIPVADWTLRLMITTQLQKVMTVIAMVVGVAKKEKKMRYLPKK